MDMIAPEIADVASAHGVELKALPRAAEQTDKQLQRFVGMLTDEVEGDVPDGLDVVLLGSFARREVTGDSDCDYLLILERTASHADIRRVVQAVETTRGALGLREHGRSQTFGDFVTATELSTRIGLDSDSNANTTRRLLLLAECQPLLRPEVTQRVRRVILERYLGDYAPDQQRDRPVRVPHFLLNDLVRYWRTIAVDFGAKQWRSLSSDWHLRHAKLLTTRKVLFAGSLAVLLDTGNALSRPQDTGADPPSAEARASSLLTHLLDGFDRTPLARLMALHGRLQPPGQAALAALLVAYDEFLDMLDDSVVRAALSSGTPLPEALGEQPRQMADRLGNVVHEALLVVFHDDPLLAAATREFAVF